MSGEHCDIFLSHSYKDREAVGKVAAELEGLGYTVYIDWKHEPLADRSKVTNEFVGRLCAAMENCHAVFLVLSPNAAASGWTPWESGSWKGGSATCSCSRSATTRPRPARTWNT